LILIDIEWTSKQSDWRTVVLSTYSARKITIKACDGIDPLLLEKTMYKNYALSNPVKLISYKEQHKIDI